MAALVQHGRRKGTVKNQGDQEQNTVALLTLNEWSRIQDQLTGANRQRDEAILRQKMKEARHQQSLATVKNWENTIEGQRLKRLENRKLKAVKEEEEKLHIDEEEARFQEEERRKAIERAKTLLYYNTDRVKTFHSHLVLSEVLREREQQIKCKHLKKGLVDLQEKKYLKIKEEEREKGIMEDIEAATKRTKAQKETHKYQFTQAAIKSVQSKEERKRQLEEQAALEREYALFREKELERERIQMKEREEHRIELDRIICDRRERAMREEERNKAEDEERRIFAEAKKNMMKQRKAKEAEIIKQAQIDQEKIRNQLQTINDAKVSNEDERIAQAVAEQDAKKQKEEKEKHDKMVQSVRDMYNHRVKMMSDLQRQEKDRADMERELLRQRVAQDERFHATQLQKQKKGLLDGRDMQKFRLAQMEERYKKEEIEMVEEHGDWETNMEFLKLEEDQFKVYAGKVIDEAKERNAPVQSLKAAARPGPGGAHPSYQATDSQGTELPSYTIDAKKLPLSWRVKNTKKRMGFNWY